MVSITGVAAYVDYDIQTPTEFATGVAGTRTGSLGMEERVTSLSVANNQNKLMTLGEVEAQGYVYGVKEGTLSIDFILSNPWWLELILERYQKSATKIRQSNALYAHKWSPTKTVRGATMEIGMNFADNPIDVLMQGVICQGVGISASVGEPVKCNTSWKFGNSTTPGTTGKTSPLTDDIKFPYTFRHATVKIGGTKVGGITNFSVNISSASDLLYNLGSPDTVGAYKGVMNYNGSLTRPIDTRTSDAFGGNSDLLKEIDKREGQGTERTIEIVFDNEDAMNSKKRIIKLTGVGVAFSNFSTGFSTDGVIEESVDFDILKVSIEAENETASSPVTGGIDSTALTS